MTPKTLDHCTAGAFDGTVPFPETIRRLTDDGVEWYCANLIFGKKTYYGSDLSHHQAAWPGYDVPCIAEAFCARSVKAAIRASQTKQISYRQFLKRIAAAGVVYYTVHLKGRRAIYFGRHGDSVIEPFPNGSGPPSRLSQPASLRR